MLTKKMEEALNDQISLEGTASFLYLSMAAWCDAQGLEGCAQFMYRQAGEEHEHMMKIFNYVLEMDGKAIAPGIGKPKEDFVDVGQMFQEVYKHEQKVTKSINDLVDFAIKENDHSTNVFLQWYVNEQREEEALMRSILDRINLIGDGPQKLYFIDKEIQGINAAELKAEGKNE